MFDVSGLRISVFANKNFKNVPIFNLFFKKVLKHNLPPYIHFFTSASRIWEHVNEFPSTGQTLHDITSVIRDFAYYIQVSTVCHTFQICTSHQQIPSFFHPNESQDNFFYI